MELKNFKLKKEDEKHYHIEHPSGKMIMVPKKGLSEKAHKIIKMCSGGEIAMMAEGGEGKVPPALAVDDAAPEAAPEAPAQQNNPGDFDITDPANQAIQPSPPQHFAPSWFGTGSPQALLDKMKPYLGPGWQNMKLDDNMANPEPAAGEAKVPSQPSVEQALGEVPSAKSPNVFATHNMDINAALREQKRGVQAEADAIANEGNAENELYKNTMAAYDELPSQNELVANNKAASDALYQAYADKKIDPNHFFTNMSTGNKIASGIALFLGGMSTPFTHQGNPALGIIENAIARDIDAQKNDQTHAHNLWTMNRQALGTDLAANIATQSQLLTGLKYKVDQAASQFKGPIAQAKAMQLKAQIDQQIAANNYRLSFMQGDTKEGKTDPNYPEKYVAFSDMFKTPEEQKMALEEIKDRKNLKTIANPSLQAFDDASKEVRPMTGGVNTSGTAFIPGMLSPAQKVWQGLAHTTVKEVEGTARQAAFDNLDKSFMPQFGDDDSTIARKRAGYINYLQSKSSAPFNSSRGNDLDRYESTRWTPPGAKGASTPIKAPNGQIKMVPNDQVPAALKAGGKRIQ